ncbi:MAG TPA: hypothetical protein VF587_02195 [Solirubrobacteraceae bacterium]|jgi:hypothetical protein
MTLEEYLELQNRSMIAFDLALGSGALLAPRKTLAALGHEEPSFDAERLFQRLGPVWLTFAAAHLMAARRGEPRDWWALAWLRGTEIATDVLWSASPAFTRPGARAGLWFAGASNLAMALGYARLARARAARPWHRRLLRSR